MAMVMPNLPSGTEQAGGKQESINVFFNRIWQGLCASGNQEPPEGVTVDIIDDLNFSLDINIRDASLYYQQASNRHDFFYFYLQQMWLILPSLKDFFVFVHGENTDTLLFNFDITAGEVKVTNSKFSGSIDRVDDDFEKMIGIIYTQAILAEYNLYKQGDKKVVTCGGDCYIVVDNNNLSSAKTALDSAGISYSTEEKTEKIPFFLTPVIPESGL